MIRTLTLTTPATTGGAGVSTSNVQSISPVSGIVYSVYLAFGDTPPAGTTVTTLKTKASPATTILSYAGATDGWRHVLHPASKSTDGAAYTDLGQLIAVCDYLVLTIAGANDADSVVATIVFEQV